MRTAATIFLLTIVTLLSAQDYPELEKRLGLIENPHSVAYDTGGFSTLPNVRELCEQHFGAIEFNTNKNAEDFCHVTDLNHDGHPDLVYSGPYMPYDQTMIFLNDGKKLDLLFDQAGELISLELFADKSVLNILKMACCCDYFSEYTEITIYNDAHVDVDQISFESNTQITVESTEDIVVRGMIRSTPELNDSPTEDECSGEIIQGNQLMKIDIPTSVILLSKSGRWKLILYPVDHHKAIVGWID